jgi:Flp pilus assembly protein TadG
MKARPPHIRTSAALRRSASLLASRGGQVAVIFALLLPILVVLIAGVLDASFALNARTRLQDANDEASLAVSIATGQNPNISEAALRAIAQNALDANYSGVAPLITDFHVCAPVQKDCTDGATTMQMGTVKVAVSAPADCVFASVVPMFCVSGSSQTVNADTVTTISFGKTLQLNLVMDSSASMIVGATPADVTTISNWVTANWALVKPGDPLPAPAGSDNPPCAFACHDVGAATKPSDIALGLTRANSAGATTRFDVMIAAAQALVSHVQTVAGSNNQNLKNAYLFNIMSFDTTLHQYGPRNIPTFPAVQAAVGQVTPGLDTYLDSAMAQLVGQVGPNGTGASALSPLKFVIVVTDGLQSDRDQNWQNCTWAIDPAWNYNSCTGGFAAPIDTSICQQMKNNGVVLAVLETPYVPLDGQDPNVSPYEKTVRKTIYPGGPASPSVVSQALAACASPGYYFQAVNSAQIATGFVALTDQFLSSTTVIQQ